MRVVTIGLVVLGAAASVVADGMVIPAQEIARPVRVPAQRALIQHDGEREMLVIETSFIGSGTNFAWVLPFPAPPEVMRAPEDLFPALEQAFEPRLVHRVHHYWLAILLAGFSLFLARRSVEDTTTWLVDLPLCLVAALLTSFTLKSWVFGFIVLTFSLLLRIVHAKQPLALVGVGYLWIMAITLLFKESQSLALINTLGGAGDEAQRAVKVLARRSVGVYDTATIASLDARALMRWLEANDYAAPKYILPAVESYVSQGWVFVATRIRRDLDTSEAMQPHPLAFRFKTPEPIYPMRLTGISNATCDIELYVMGRKRAKARHFKDESCLPTDSAAAAGPQLDARKRVAWLAGIETWTGAAPVGTKLVGKLTADEMASDVQIQWRRYSPKYPVLYSHSGAATIGANLASVLGVTGCLWGVFQRGTWGATRRVSRRLVLGFLLVALAIGASAYLVLPKTGVVTHYVQHPEWAE